MIYQDVISLTRELLTFNTLNPDGNEEDIARFAGKLLSENEFTIDYHQLAENRFTLIAEKGLSR